MYNLYSRYIITHDYNSYNTHSVCGVMITKYGIPISHYNTK